jgi:hypothetical protein
MVRGDLRGDENEANYQRTFSTDRVTQINGGKLTSYPYNLNIQDDHDARPGDGFLHNAAEMNLTQPIKETHEQVYQCNMNGDDITVWYALAEASDALKSRGDGYFWQTNNDGTISGKRNDAANAYYLFSRGNVTYTGAGHTNEFTTFEAKLFINTLVASYKSEFTLPTVDYRDSSNSKNNRYLLVTPEVDPITNKQMLVSESDIYFVYSDSNMGGKMTEVRPTVKFYYLDDKGVEHDITSEVKIYNDKGQVAQLNKQTLYHFELPDDIEARFWEQNADLTNKIDPETNDRIQNDRMKEKLYCRPTTIVKLKDGTQKELVGPVTYLEIRRLDISNLG